MLPTSAEARVLNLYRRVGARAAGWAERVPLIAEAGFRILCGPPIECAPMVVSLNPGLHKNTEKILEHDNDGFWPERWPERMSYCTGLSAFARKITQVVEGAGISVEAVNAGYVLMFRSKKIEQWKAEVPVDVRKDAEHLSLEVLAEINTILRPKFIYAAGFDTFKRMGCSIERVEHGQRNSGNDFALLRFGYFGDVPLVASPHLSGSRLNRENLGQIARWLAYLHSRCT